MQLKYVIEFVLHFLSTKFAILTGKVRIAIKSRKVAHAVRCNNSIKVAQVFRCNNKVIQLIPVTTTSEISLSIHSIPLS